MANRFMPAETKVFGRKPRRFRAAFFVGGAASPTINYPTTLAGAGFARAERMAPGKFEFELSDVWPTTTLYEYGCVYGDTAENTDMYTQVTPSVSGTTGRLILTVRFKTGAVNTDPVNPSLVVVWAELESAP